MESLRTSGSEDLGLIEEYKSGWNNVLTEFEGVCVTFIKYLCTKMILKITSPSATPAAVPDSSDIFKQLSMPSLFKRLLLQVSTLALLRVGLWITPDSALKGRQIRLQFCSQK